MNGESFQAALLLLAQHLQLAHCARPANSYPCQLSSLDIAPQVQEHYLLLTAKSIEASIPVKSRKSS